MQILFSHHALKLVYTPLHTAQKQADWLTKLGQMTQETK